MKKLILLILSILLFLLPLASALPNHYYQIDLEYDDGKVSYKTMKILLTADELEEYGADYEAELVSFDNQLLNVTYFGFPLKIYYDYMEDGLMYGGSVTLTKANTTIYIPYYKNAKEIQVFDDDYIKKLTIPVDQYSTEIPKILLNITDDNITMGNVTEVESTLTVDKTTPAKKPRTYRPEVLALMVGVGILIILLIVLVIITIVKKLKE